MAFLRICFCSTVAGNEDAVRAKQNEHNAYAHICEQIEHSQAIDVIIDISDGFVMGLQWIKPKIWRISHALNMEKKKLILLGLNRCRGMSHSLCMHVILRVFLIHQGLDSLMMWKDMYPCPWRVFEWQDAIIIFPKTRVLTICLNKACWLSIWLSRTISLLHRELTKIGRRVKAWIMSDSGRNKKRNKTPNDKIIILCIICLLAWAVSFRSHFLSTGSRVT